LSSRQGAKKPQAWNACGSISVHEKPQALARLRFIFQTSNEILPTVARRVETPSKHLHRTQWRARQIKRHVPHHDSSGSARNR